MFTFKLKRFLGVKFLLFMMGGLMAACSEPSSNSNGDNNSDFVIHRQRQWQRDCVAKNVNDCTGQNEFIGRFTIIGKNGEEYYNYAFGYDSPFGLGRASRRREFSDRIEDLGKNFLMAGTGALLCEGQTWLAEEVAIGLGFSRLKSDCSHTASGNRNRHNFQQVNGNNANNRSFLAALVFYHNNKGVVDRVGLFVDYNNDRTPDDSIILNRVNNRLFRTADGQVELKWVSSGRVELSWHDGGGDNPFRRRVVFGEFRR